jgi:two-component system NtrC family response regulator
VPLLDGAVVRLGDSLLVFRTEPPAESPGAHDVFPGISPAAVAVRRSIAMLVDTPGHVLILGETGTGKERVARAFADRRDRPFVTQNCAELTRELARSELFGHVRGAFSGATGSKPGLVDIAADGVLFLDEIGELPLDVQGDLLRFLEDGSYRAIGSVDLRHSPARVVAATNVDLDAAVGKGTFRRDLAARLRANHAPLELPPLRDRGEDIPGWTHRFLVEAGHDVVQPCLVGALECMLLYPWLDNLRELRSMVRTVVAATPTFPWSADVLPERIRVHRQQLREHSSPPAEPAAGKDPTRDEVESALRGAAGRVRAAALQLGVDRRKLYRLCERYGIALDEYRRENPTDNE